MRRKLLIPALLFAMASQAQDAIGSFYSFTNNSTDNYSLVSSSTDLNEATGGANVTWNFTNLTQESTTTTQVTTPAADDVATYPGSTMMVETVSLTNSGSNTTRYFINQDLTGGMSLTGAEASGMVLNYSTNNAFIGAFPLSYGYTNTDQVAGTFDGLGYSGTFTGTGTSTVDAYGTLTTNVGVANNTAVTRLKTVQNILLYYSGIQAGTLTQTIYSYYNSATLSTGPLFRSITSHLVVALAGINQTVSSLESYTTTAGTQKFNTNKIVVAPNPVNDILHFSGAADFTNVSITDAAGRTVLKASGNDINVSHLSAGVYYVTAQTEAGSLSSKIVKQ